MAKSSEPILIDTIREANDLHSVVLQLHSNGYVSSNTKCVLEKYFCGDCDCLDLSSITNAQSGENVRFPADVESFAICLAFLSTKAYELLTKCWPDGLPTIDTVREWHRRYDGMPGLNMSVIVAVKDRIAKAKKDAVDLLFSLHMRSITLNAVLDYDRVSQTVTGHEDFGYVDRRHFSERFEEENVASEAILFLLDCVNADMHVPVAYFMVSNLDCSQRANIVQEVINFIETNDIRMISLTIDGWPREHSIEMCAQLAANSSEDNMQSLFQSLNGNNIHVVFEASCLVTLLRNMLAYKGMIYDANNRQIRWDLITKLCKNQHLRGMQCELTNNHMRFSENMFKVTLAMETMNRRVAAGILSMSQNTKCNDRLPEVEPTAAYLTAIHDLLDLLHSKQDIALSGDYQRTFDAMNESLLYLQSCSCKENNRLKSSTVHAHGQNAALIGLQASVQSIHGIFDEYVVERKLLTSIVPDNFSNNKMDTFIACMRRKGLGQFGDCATAQQIVDSYRRLLLMKCRNNSAKNASGRRVIEINAIFDARDIPHTEAELTQQ